MDFLKSSEEKLTEPVKDTSDKKLMVTGKLEADLFEIKHILDNDSDVLYRQFKIAGNDAVLVFCDGLCNGKMINDGILRPLTELKKAPFSSFDLPLEITEKTYSGTDFKQENNLYDVFPLLFSGFCILLVDSVDKAFCFSAQGFEKRSVEQPYTEVQEKGAMECFVENLTDNIAMLRRRLKTPELRIEELKIGSSSNTRVCICFLKGRVKSEYVSQIRKRLKNVKIDALLSADYLTPFLDTDYISFFSAVGRTERPDTFSSKLVEGRVGIIADGSPFALFVPFLFTECFQTLDDYSYRPYYAVFIRALRLLCFFISVTLPGLYVAVCVYHQEVLSQALLVEIAVQENVTPFSITVEALTVHIMYEIVREAGLRMPKAVGHAVSIVGALVIGEAAVTAGIIAAPMVIIVALTAIGSFVVSPFYESVSVLRLIFIITGGLSGFFGIMLLFGVTVINICVLNPYRVPYSATLMPSNIGSFRDVLFRRSWKNLGKRTLKIDRMEK